jgi:hypothetical protein
MSAVIYVMHPLGDVHPVRVQAAESFAVLAEALEAVGLLGGDLIDEDWLLSEEAAVQADGARLVAALTRYRELPSGDIGCAFTDALDDFFTYVDEIAGRTMVIERQR